jgi:hypothetical protein
MQPNLMKSKGRKEPEMGQQALSQGNKKGGDARKLPTFVENLFNLAEAAIVDLPVAAAKRLAGSSNERDLHEAGWKAYDAVVAIANDATNRVFTTPAIAGLTSRSLEGAVRWQRLNNAVSGAFFAALWPSIGLPTATEVQAARDELSEIRDEIQALRIESEQRAVSRREFKPAASMPPARLDLERAMSTTGIFQQPMYSDWSAQQMAAEASSNVRN